MAYILHHRHAIILIRRCKPQQEHVRKLASEKPKLWRHLSQLYLHAGDLLLVLCLTMASSVLSASFAVFLVRERECHSKGVQMVAGASPSAFWSAAYVWDLLNFSIPTLGAAICSRAIATSHASPLAFCGAACV